MPRSGPQGKMAPRRRPRPDRRRRGGKKGRAMSEGSAKQERGFGVAGALPHDIIRTLAPAAEAAGYGAFWVNDTPQGDGLAALAVAAAVTKTIRLGVGV